ncbi:MAG TPA: mycothiol conjugate amidase Mca [Actinomycetes bacterium]|nr:mycothiol conjugate amidase Mca [Actinomycetes bacterium]
MSPSPNELRLLSVHAHPDDESSKGAATTARYVAEGVEVMVATCTGGERGEVLNPKLQDDPWIAANLADVRRAEMDRAREILGVRQEWLGFVDSGYVEDYTPADLERLPDGCFARVPMATAVAPLVKLIREFRPHVVTTYDENGGYPHPDHIMCHLVSVAAFDAASKAEEFPEAGAPWLPQKLYYQLGFHKERFVALHEATLAAGIESPFAEWLEEWVDRPEDQGRVTTMVPCGDYFGVRDEALRAHATQVDGDGWWFSVPLEVQQRAWPTEDYELARSVVDTDLPEDDLFAGIR